MIAVVRTGECATARRLRRALCPKSSAMIYQIHRYPTDLIDVISLADQRVVIRPVLPQDEQSMGAFFCELSASARYDQFMTPLRKVPRDMLKWLTHVDYVDHLALLAGGVSGRA